MNRRITISEACYNTWLKTGYYHTFYENAVILQIVALLTSDRTEQQYHNTKFLIMWELLYKTARNRFDQI